MKVFSIYDSKAEAYLQPFFMKTAGEAIRALMSLVNDPSHNFFKYSEDFTLFELATFDESTGLIAPLSTAVSVVRLHELKASSQA